MSGQTPTLGGAAAANSYVCPSDRHLALRAQLKAGWSVRSGGDVSSPLKAPVSTNSLSETELEQIKNVLAKAERTEKQEQERVGRLVDKLNRMKRVAAGNGVTQCVLCGSEFGLLGARSYAAMCHDCRRYVCQKNCGLETLDSHNQPVFLCKLCSETREMWKKTGAWFYQDVPKYVLPDHQRSASSEPGWSRGSRTCPVASSLSAQLQAQSANSHSGSLANWNDDWDSSNRPSPGSSPSRKSQSSWGASNYDRCKGSPTKRRVLPVPPSNEKRYSGPFQPRWAIKNPSTDTSSSDEGGRIDNSKFPSPSTHSHASGLPSHHLSRQNMPPMSSSGGRNSQKLPSNNIQTFIQPRGRRFTETSSSDTEEENESRDGRPPVPITGVVPAGKRPSTAASHVSTQRTPSRTSQLTEPHHHLPSTNNNNNNNNKSGSFSTVTRINEPGSTSPTAAGPNVVPNLSSSLTTRSDSPDARSVDSGVIPSDRSTSHPTSLGASSSQSKFNVNNSRNHSISSENAQIIAPEKSIMSNNQPSSNLLNDSQEKLSKMSLDLSGNKPPTCIFTPNSDVASSPEDDTTSLGTVEFALRYDPEAQTLSAVIIRAKNLKAMDSNGFSDPYVKLHLLPDSSKSTKLRTRTVRRSLNPEWNEQLIYYGVTEDDRLKKTFLLTVLDEDRFGSDFIGETRLPLKRLTVGREKLFNVYLEKQRPIEKIEGGNEERGKILFSLKYNTTKQVLIVGVIRCVQLTGMDASGYSDPYVKISLKPESEKHHRAKTKVKKKTLNPEFNEEFEFCVTLADLPKKVLDLSVWDRDVGKQDDFIGKVQVGVNAKADRQKHWLDCIRSPNTTFQRWHKLQGES